MKFLYPVFLQYVLIIEANEALKAEVKKKIDIFLHGLPYANTIFVNNLKRGINPEENTSVDWWQ